MRPNRGAVRQPPTAAGGAGAASSCRSAPRPARRGIGAARAEPSGAASPPLARTDAGEGSARRWGGGSRCPRGGVRRCRSGVTAAHPPPPAGGALRCAALCGAERAVPGAATVSAPAALPPSFAAEGGGGPGRSAAAPRPLAPLAAPGRAGCAGRAGAGPGPGAAGAPVRAGGPCAPRVPARAAPPKGRHCWTAFAAERGCHLPGPPCSSVGAGEGSRCPCAGPSPCHPRARRAAQHREGRGCVGVTPHRTGGSRCFGFGAACPAAKGTICYTACFWALLVCVPTTGSVCIRSRHAFVCLYREFVRS